MGVILTDLGRSAGMLHHRIDNRGGSLRRSPADEEYVCWTKMQAEAGQPIELIVGRKELERQAGDGRFMWGVGNAPAVLTNTLARLSRAVPVVFSLMKSKPKVIDSAPSSVLIWRRFIDLNGYERDLPPNAVVTSRGGEDWENKRHYALMCYSPAPLRVGRGEGFDHRAYRNASETGAPVGPSQVTSLLRRVEAPSEETDYEVSFRATLVDSYWVKLADPRLLSGAQLDDLGNIQNVRGARSWLSMARELRGTSPTDRMTTHNRLLL